MSLFKGPMHTRIEGYKELTESKNAITIHPTRVSIPVFAGADTTPEILVKEGDEVLVGTKIAQFNKIHTVPIFSSVSGVVVGIEEKFHQTLKKAKHVVIESDGKYTEAVMPTIDYKTATKEELVEFMMNSGLIGCGGAGFPTYAKYKNAQDIETLIINAVECEPYITSDCKILETEFETVLLGIKAMHKMCGAKQVLLAIKETHPELIREVTEKLKDEKDITCVSVPNVYPMGWERTIVYQLTKKRYDKLPSEVNCIVGNSTTCYWFGKAMEHGVPIMNRMLTVSGDGVAEPCNVIAPIGSSVKDVVAACGGYTSEDIIICFGGPMMGGTVTTDLTSVDRPNNAITILKKQDVPEMPCLRCGSCSDHCPCGLQPVRIAQAAKQKDVDRLGVLEVTKCMECGLCTYVCPSKIKVTENVRRAKRTYTLAQAKKK